MSCKLQGRISAHFLFLLIYFCRWCVNNSVSKYLLRIHDSFYCGVIYHPNNLTIQSIPITYFAIVIKTGTYIIINIWIVQYLLNKIMSISIYLFIIIFVFVYWILIRKCMFIPIKFIANAC